MPDLRKSPSGPRRRGQGGNAVWTGREVWGTPELMRPGRSSSKGSEGPGLRDLRLTRRPTCANRSSGPRGQRLGEMRYGRAERCGAHGAISHRSNRIDANLIHEERPDRGLLSRAHGLKRIRAPHWPRGPQWTPVAVQLLHHGAIPWGHHHNVPGSPGMHGVKVKCLTNCLPSGPAHKLHHHEPLPGRRPGIYASHHDS